MAARVKAFLILRESIMERSKSWLLMGGYSPRGAFREHLPFQEMR
jgi:hypothetical protein